MHEQVTFVVILAVNLCSSLALLCHWRHQRRFNSIDDIYRCTNQPNRHQNIPIMCSCVCAKWREITHDDDSKVKRKKTTNPVVRTKGDEANFHKFRIISWRNREWKIADKQKQQKKNKTTWKWRWRCCERDRTNEWKETKN